MASPFPGMDPYLEDPAFWPDFHRTFINYWREAIADQLPENYEARIGEQVYLVEEPPSPRKLVEPEVVIILDEPSEPYIEILHRPERTLVAMLELLSPANKEEPGRRAYLTKRNAVLGQRVHLVELDLLLRGQRLPLERVLPPADYYYLVYRSDHRPDCDVYAWNLREALPTLPLPLQKPDPDLLIDLAAVFHTTFERGRFSRSLRYDEPLSMRRGKEEREWMRKTIASFKRRHAKKD
jgi:Protein of unknown function (DUF4058)